MAGLREESAVAYHSYEVGARKTSTVDMTGGTMLDTANVTTMAKEGDVSSLSSGASVHGDRPTEEEMATLRHIPDIVPARAFLVALVELAERFTYYGLSGLFTNYVNNPYPGVVDGKVSADRANKNFVAGALGMGTQAANGLVTFFQFFCYITPILGAIVADQYIGRYRTIVLFGIVYIVGTLILWVSSLPVAIENGAGLGGLVTAMIVIGFGTGGIKSNVSPLIAEQYRPTQPFVDTLKSGERVIREPSMTVQRIYMYFYICINIGGLSSIATTEMERHLNFWPAFLMCWIMMIIAVVIVILGRKYYITRPPTGSVIFNGFKAMWIAATNKFNLEAAKPSYQEQNGGKYAGKIPWTDTFIDELKPALVACSVFVFYPIYWVTYGQMLTNFVVQAGYMALHGIPNDLMQNIDPIAIILFIPILDLGVYPALRKVGIKFLPITRIFMGFVFAAGAMAYAAGVQKLIYEHGVGKVHVAIQTPAYVLIALSEIFASITGLEYAYTKAPASMKSFIMSMFLLTNAFGSALQEALTPVSTYDTYMWAYAGLAIATIIVAGLFWVIYGKFNKTEEEMNRQQNLGPSARRATEATRRVSIAQYGAQREPQVGNEVEQKV